MNGNRALPIFLTLLSAGLTFAQEQVRFSADDSGVNHPVSIPDAAFALLAHDKGVADQFPNGAPRSAFSAAAVHLNGAELDLIVMGLHELRGANVTIFWLFRPKGNSYELMLDGAVAHDLEILKTRTNGYRNIDTFVATAVKVTTNHLKFQNGAYHLVGSEVKDIK